MTQQKLLLKGQQIIFQCDNNNTNFTSCTAIVVHFLIGHYFLLFNRKTYFLNVSECSSKLTNFPKIELKALAFGNRK